MGERYPEKAIEIRVTVSGFDWEDVVDSLMALAKHVDECRSEAGGLVARGYGTSRTCSVRTRDVTREQFSKEVAAWAAERGMAPGVHIPLPPTQNIAELEDVLRQARELACLADKRLKDARIAELEAELDYYKNPRCWHCGVHLAEENLVQPMRCTSCPEEGCCDDGECDQPGCADDVAAFRDAGGES